MRSRTFLCMRAPFGERFSSEWVQGFARGICMLDVGLRRSVESVHGGFCGELGVTDRSVGFVLVGSLGRGEGTCFVTPS